MKTVKFGTGRITHGGQVFQDHAEVTIILHEKEHQRFTKVEWENLSRGETEVVLSFPEIRSLEWFLDTLKETRDIWRRELLKKSICG